MIDPRVRSLRDSFRPPLPDDDRPAHAGTSFVQGLLNNVLDPKVADAYVLARMSLLFARQGVPRWLERVTGGVLVALGVRLAFERR